MTGGDVVLWAGNDPDAHVWQANAAPGCRAELCMDDAPPGAALRFGFALSGHGAWAIARREIRAALPVHYVAILDLSGTGGPVELQLKLIDPGGRNVWWWRRSGVTFDGGSEHLVFRKAALEFAWGPLSGGDPSEIGAVELAVAADSAAAGAIAIAALRIEARDPASAHPHIVALRASSAAPGHDATAIARNGSWRPGAGDSAPWLELDLGRSTEFGGVILGATAALPDCALLAPTDSGAPQSLAMHTADGTTRAWLRTANAEARTVRVVFAPAAELEIADAQVAPIELAISPTRYLSRLARAAPRGRYPRHLLDEQGDWAVVGADGDTRKGLLGADGAIEVGAESFTLEPFIWCRGALITWADVAASSALIDGHLPIPSVTWTTPELALEITACASGAAEASTLVARYVLTNRRAAPATLRLFVAVRPLQVTPAWQSLNLRGGVAPITRLRADTRALTVNGRDQVVAITAPDALGMASSEVGLTQLEEGRIPDAATIDDPVGFAAAAFAFDFALAPGSSAVVAFAVPLHDAAPAPPRDLTPTKAAAWIDARIADTAAYWRERLARVPIALPASAAPFADTLRASIGWILVNREGPRIQPGPRCYRRSWIRDGVLTGTALAEMGLPAEGAAFLRWYAPFQLPDGRVPCAVDRHGIDRAIEHDSHGELIWGAVEMYRLTRDRALLDALWPHVRLAAEAIIALRAERTTAAYRETPYFGLLPESISHEGYASHPVHSYWDDFFALRGLADAAAAATVIGDSAAAETFAGACAAMRGDVHASILRCMADHGLDVLPGSAELGDFDPTSTAIALDPCGEASTLPADALARTFARYWEEFVARRDGTQVADAYTPYEIRTAAAFILLGAPDRAQALLEWLMGDQRPVAWRQWPEIAWRNRRAPRFLGDLPHGWIASSFLRAVRRMIAYERPADGALVLAAGIPATWVREPPGVRVRSLPTHFGPLDYTLAAERDDRIRLTLGNRFAPPPGGVVVVSPGAIPLRAVIVDGREHAVDDAHSATLSAPAADVVLVY
jgi:hypothetical protein